ncbi:MAG: hypothetical protein ABI352_09120 [Candidatus Dormibacter sp.]
MADVELPLTAAMVGVAPIDPAHPQAQQCLNAYFAELDRRFDTGFDPSLSISAVEDELRPPAGLLLVATLQADPIGCGALEQMTVHHVGLLRERLEVLRHRRRGSAADLSSPRRG